MNFCGPANSPEAFWIGWEKNSSKFTSLSELRLSPNISSANMVQCLWAGGFIANRSDLLIQAGLPTSTPDVQLLLHLYTQYDLQGIDRIAGPFAWIIWDARHKRLLVARDRLGIHGLYYREQSGTIFISNRIEILLKLMLPGTATLNPRSIVAQMNALAPLPGETFYREIRAVQPGEALIFTEYQINTHQYWQIGPRPILRLPSDADYATTFRAIFFQVIAEYLPDRPVAVTLSNGMDSTSVAAAIKAVQPNALLTAFTWITPELAESDESAYALAVSEHLGVPAVTIHADQFWSLQSPDGIKTSAGTPYYLFYDELWCATFHAIQQSNIGVVFSGISGDHLFGYEVFAYPDLLLKGQWGELARQLRQHVTYSKLSFPQIIRSMLLRPIIKAYWPAHHHQNPRPVPWLTPRYQSLLSRDLLPEDGFYPMLPGRRQRLMLLQDRILSHTLELNNRQASEYSLDFRHPLVDHRLIEFALSIPTEQTFNAAIRKIVVRNAMRDYLPEKILDLKDKIYPTAISNRGLREREKEKVWALMTNMRAADLGFVNQARLRAAYEQFLTTGKGARFWYTLTLEDWLRRHF